MSRNLFLIPSPTGEDPVVYTSIVIQRAPNSSPASFVTIATVAIDTTNESTEYMDAAGALDDWYRYYYTDGATNSDYSLSIQAGDYLVRQWCKADIPDTDITNTNWDTWRDQTIQQMAADGLGRPAATLTVTCTSNKDEWHSLVSGIRRVTRVDLYDSASNFVTIFRNWRQRGRKLRIFFPRTAVSYLVYGQAELRGLSDMDDELFGILYWGMRWRYLLFRQRDRLDFRPYLARTRLSDTTTSRDYQSLAVYAKAQYDDQVNKWLQSFDSVSSGGGVA